MRRSLLGVLSFIPLLLAGGAAQASTTANAKAGAGVIARPVSAGADGSWWLVKGADLTTWSGLRDVAAAGPSDVWAAGFQQALDDGTAEQAVQHWNGVTWSTMYPGGGLSAVGGLSVSAPDDVWAVGAAGPTAWAGHWNGTTWTSHYPYGPAVQDGDIRDVAVSAGRPWFVGTVRWGMRAVLLGWSQRRGFYRVCESAGTLESVTKRKTVGEIWAVGTTANQPLIIRSDGRTCQKARVPAIADGRLARVWQVARNDVWAVGHTDDSDAGPPSKPIVLHYDGKAWRKLKVPVAEGRLSGVTGDASGAVWFSGVDRSRPDRVLFLRYAGGAWSTSYGPELRMPAGEYTEGDSPAVTQTSITRVPGSSTLWAVATSGVGEATTHHILRRG